MSSNSPLPYAISAGIGTGIGSTVTYNLSQEEFNRYGVASAQATVYNVKTPSCLDLICTFTTKGANPGQSVTLSPLNVTYGNTQRTWCEPGGYQGITPRGAPW